MRQSQAEIKSIEAELRSIRADQPARPVTLLDPNAQWEVTEPPISPTITRSSTALHTSPRPQKNPVSASQRSDQRSGLASVECFPFPEQGASDLSGVVRQLRQPRRRNAAAVQLQLVQQREAVRQQFEAKARQINSLSQQQEAIIRELAALSEQIEQAWQSIDPESNYSLEPICEYLGTEIPCVEQDENGTLLLTAREIEWQPNHYHPEHYRSGRSRSHTNRSLLVQMGRFIWQTTLGTLNLVGTVGRTAGTLASLLITLPVRLLGGQTATEPRRKTYRGSGRRTAAPEAPLTLQSALLLAAGSAALRFGLDWVVAVHPTLWLPSIVVMVAPALFAVYRATVAPQSGFAWGYRLFAILIGLLIGGRL